ncbi:DUF2238 domain-containing protein [Paenibacillus cremeus]|uniref:DUF2238 domain-containing protein n=2 Tax=Paenibacillus cremeus TaxID=2163881 RepID=A0A559KEX0_9BACL|nr:DUF2238 domain-containing protein [Paenibacillus cremeus]
MENILVLAAVIFLTILSRKFPLSNQSYFLIFIFLCFHTYAAHYTYDGTPFDRWLKENFHAQRSYFDRVVHFLFGLLLAPVLKEVLVRTNRLKGLWIYALPVACVFALSAFFEILEMFVALFGGSAGEDYMGLQGDIYDSQKDMGLGLLGGACTMGWLAWRQKHRHSVPE